MNYFIIVYKNTHDAMYSEKILNENNFEFKIMPTPTSITQSCGICTRFSREEEVRKIIQEKIIDFKNVYEKDSQGFKLIA